MPTVIATPGAPDANSYLTVGEADAYQAGRLHNDAWTAADQPTKEASLLWATRLLERESWVGERVLLQQALRWPRYNIYDQDGFYLNSATIPKALKDATAELAFLLISQDRTSEAGTEGFSKIVVGPVEIDVNSIDRISTISPAVYDMIGFWITSGRTSVRMDRG